MEMERTSDTCTSLDEFQSNTTKEDFLYISFYMKFKNRKKLINGVKVRGCLWGVLTGKGHIGLLAGTGYVLLWGLGGSYLVQEER